MSKLDVEKIEAGDVVKELVEAHRMCRRCFSVIGRLLKRRTLKKPLTLLFFQM